MEHKELGTFIDRTYKVVRQDLLNRFKAAGLDLTPEQWILLQKLSHHSLTQSDLANESFKDKPTVSRIIDLLVKKNLVQRMPDTSDKRRFRVGLTDQGQEMIEKATPAVEASRAIGWSNITEREYEDLIATLNKIFHSYSN